MSPPRSSIARAGLVACSLIVLAVSSRSAAAGPAQSVFAWQEAGAGLESADVTAVAVSPDRPGVVWVGAGGSVYRSRDGGQSWDRRLTVRGMGAQVLPDDETDDDGEEDWDWEIRDSVTQFAEEVRAEFIDDLTPDYGAELAEDLADDLVADLLEDLADEIATTRDFLDRRRMARERVVHAEDLDELERAIQEEDELDEEEEPFSVEDLLGDRVHMGLDRIHRIDTASGGRVAVASSGGLFFSLDEGETFSQATVGLGEEGRVVLSVRWDPARSERLLAGTEEGLWISLDHGVTFTRAGGLADRGAVQDIAVDPRASDRVLAATEQGLLRSDDGGISFVDVWSPTDEELADVRAVDFDGRLPGRAYAGTAGGLLLSSDGGETFTRIDSPGMTTRVVHDLRTWPYRAGGLVVATPLGVFASRDGAQHFHEGFPGLPVRKVQRVAPVPDAFPELFAATSGGLFRWLALPDEAPRVELIDAVMGRAPALPEIAHAALTFAHMETSWFQDAHRRAGRSAMLPQVIGSFFYRDRSRELHVRQLEAPNRRQLTLDDDMRWFVNARWDLDRIIFSDRTLAASRGWSHVRRERARVLDRVGAAYSAWVSLSVRAEQVGARDLREALMLRMQIAEIEAQLDALTGGFFTRSLEESAAM